MSNNYNTNDDENNNNYNNLELRPSKYSPYNSFYQSENNTDNQENQSNKQVKQNKQDNQQVNNGYKEYKDDNNNSYKPQYSNELNNNTFSNSNNQNLNSPYNINSYNNNSFNSNKSDSNSNNNYSINVKSNQFDSNFTDPSEIRTNLEIEFKSILDRHLYILPEYHQNRIKRFMNFTFFLNIGYTMGFIMYFANVYGNNAKVVTTSTYGLLGFVGIVAFQHYTMKALTSKAFNDFFKDKTNQEIDLSLSLYRNNQYS